jgi:hypothetical protein
METITEKPQAMSGLFGNLRREMGKWIREEVQLAKTEMTEKASTFGRNAIELAAGGVAALAGFLVLLTGLGFLLALAFEGLGWSPALADFVGFSIIGMAVIAVGAGLIMKARRTLASESLAPKKTLQGLPFSASAKTETKAPIKPTAEQIEAQVASTRSEVKQTLNEIRGRMSLGRANRNLKAQISRHPARSVLVGLACGVASGMAYRRRMRRRAVRELELRKSRFVAGESA